MRCEAIYASQVDTTCLQIALFKTKVLVALASTLVAMASNLIAMASN